jgi:hypothetical protein
MQWASARAGAADVQTPTPVSAAQTNVRVADQGLDHEAPLVLMTFPWLTL